MPVDKEKVQKSASEKSAEEVNPEAPVSDPVTAGFLAHLGSARGCSAYTLRNYAHALKDFRHWFSEVHKAPPQWEHLSRDDFRAYVRYLGRLNMGRAAIHLRFSALRGLYKFLVREGKVAGSPLKNIPLPKQPRRLPKFLSREQMEDLLNAPRKLLSSGDQTGKPDFRALVSCARDEAIFETFYSCGLRISEICGLLASDLDFNEGLVKVRGKGRKERLVPIGQKALETIIVYRKLLCGPLRSDVPLFLSSRGRGDVPVNPRDVQRRLKKYLAVAGLDPHLTPHKLRHSYATHMLDAGADLRSVQELLGHAHLTSTQVYTHVTTERLKRAYDNAHPRA